MFIDAEIVRAVKQLGRDEGATLFMTLLAAFVVLLSRYSGEEDVIIGTPIAGRTRPELEDLIGLFVNTLVLRIHTGEEPDFVEVVRRVRNAVFEAHEHQHVPFEKLVAELRPARDLQSESIFPGRVRDAARVGCERRTVVRSRGIDGVAPGSAWTAKFDLEMYLEEWPTGVYGYVEYATELFDRRTVERLVTHYGRLLEAVVADRRGAVGRLRLLSAAEEREQVEDWNATARAYPAERGVHGLVAGAGGGPAGRDGGRVGWGAA